MRKNFVEKKNQHTPLAVKIESQKKKGQEKLTV